MLYILSNNWQSQYVVMVKSSDLQITCVNLGDPQIYKLQNDHTMSQSSWTIDLLLTNHKVF